MKDTQDNHSHRMYFRLPAKLTYSDALFGVVEAHCQELSHKRGLEKNFAFQVLSGFQEACKNCIKHCHEENEEQILEIDIWEEGEALHFQMQGEGAEFSFDEITEPSHSPLPDVLTVSCKGLYILHSCMTSVLYNRVDGVNRLRFSKSFQ